MAVDQTQYPLAMADDATTGKPMPVVGAQLMGSYTTSPTSDNRGLGATNALEVLALPHLYSGNGFDRQYNNTQGTLLASVARTATAVSAIQTNFNAKGVIIFLNVTAASGTGGLTVRIRGISPAGMPHYLNAAPTAIVTTGSKIYELYPASTGATTGDVQQRTPAVLPRTWALEVTHSDGSSYTYQVDYSLIL